MVNHHASFEWVDDVIDAATLAKAQSGDGRGAMVWFYATDDATTAAAKTLQTSTFLDPRVRAAGKGLLLVKADRSAAADWFDALGLTKTPTLVVVPSGVKAPVVLPGDVKASALAKAMQAAGG